MSEQQSEKSIFSSAFMGIVIVIGTVVVCGGIFVLLLVKSAEDHAAHAEPGGEHAGAAEHSGAAAPAGEAHAEKPGH